VPALAVPVRKYRPLAFWAPEVVARLVQGVVNIYAAPAVPVLRRIVRVLLVRTADVLPPSDFCQAERVQVLADGDERLGRLLRGETVAQQTGVVVGATA
jgi:hypothetical protein